MLSKKLVIFTLFLSVTGCITQNSFQPARHDAEYWQKPNESYNFNTTLSDMKSCGWLRPKDNLDENGKINRKSAVQHQKISLMLTKNKQNKRRQNKKNEAYQNYFFAILGICNMTRIQRNADSRQSLRQTNETQRKGIARDGIELPSHHHSLNLNGYGRKKFD